MEVQNEDPPPNGLLHVRGKPPTLLPSRKSDPQQQQNLRISLDSAAEQSVSTLSPFLTPTSPSFLPQSGLAPRPPSFPYKSPHPRSGLNGANVGRHSDGERSDRPTTSWGTSGTVDLPRNTSQEHSKSFSARARAFSVKFEDEVLGVGFVTSTQGLRESGKPHGDSLKKTDEKITSSPIVAVAQTEPPQQRSERRIGSVQEPASHTQSQRHSYSRSVSAPINRVLRREWAPDRSPLQKLELTLRDITKEERRAQLEEAELLVREARSGYVGHRIVGDVPSTSLTRSATLEEKTIDRLPETGAIRGLSSKQRDRIQRSATIDTRSPVGAVPEPVGTTSAGFDYHEKRSREKPKPDVTIPPLRVGGMKPQQSTTQSVSRNQSEARPPLATLKSTTDSEQGKDELQSPTMSVQNPREIPSKRQIASDPRNLSSPPTAVRPERISSRLGAPNVQATAALPERGATSITTADNYSRRRSLSVDSPQDSMAPNRDLSGRRGQMEMMGGLLRPEKVVTNRQTEEQGESKAKKDDSFRDKAWWENGSTAKATRSSISKRQGRLSQDMWQSVDDAEENGRQSSDHLSDSGSFVYPPDMSRRKRWHLSARRYTAHQSTANKALGVGWRKKQWFSYLFTSTPQPDSTSLSTVSTSPWSYSCPHLSEHDIFHPFHVCPPSSDKELTRSLRLIRLRPVAVPTSFTPPLYLKCGPLLRYLGIRQEADSPSRSLGNDSAAARREIWRGSVMIVTTDSDSIYEPAPTLRLFSQQMKLIPTAAGGSDTPGPDLPEYVDNVAGLPKVTRTGKTMYVKPVDHLEDEKDLSRIENDGGLFEETRSPVDVNDGGPDPQGQTPTYRRVEQPDGEELGKFKEVKGVRLYAENGITFWRFTIEVELRQQQARIAYRINRGPAIGFWVPAKGETMNIMFHSCNGFSLNVNPNQFSGPDPLWRDVLNAHQTRPFHAMIGGGDQIYNDSVGKQTSHFQSWLAMRNPIQKRSAEFTLEMQDELGTYYLERYSMWFSQGLFGMAASQIPMINIWDDHDIIDGFGSYPHHFMVSQVFSGLGTVAFKYYMLFQHQSVGTATSITEPSWLLGASPGPYIRELSRSVFMFLGMKVAFLGLDCRTERTRDEILSDETYGLVFDRCRKEIIKGETKHLIVLLGVPIAYPRLVWLENVLTSKILDPVKALGRSGVLGGFANKLDGGVEILDDLDDHWTAKNHKAERNWLIQELQHLAAEKSVRITILSGDVHQAAIGQFYSNPKLEIAKDKDHRYMPNVISSAIVNAPPPEVLSDVLNKRNRVHHLDVDTDEDMIPMFPHDVDGKLRNNKRLLPRRNWCSIREYNPGTTPPPTPPTPEAAVSPEQQPRSTGGGKLRSMSLSRREIRPGQLFRRLSRRKTYVEQAAAAAGGADVAAADEAAADAIVRPSESADNYFPPHPPSSGGVRDNVMTSGRPNPFHRQTTDFLERKKGGGAGGNSARDQATIDLRDGLDIALNVEINQKDPAGITTPYRLLVPALWHEDPSEIEPEEAEDDDDAEGGGSGNRRERRKSSWLSWAGGGLFKTSSSNREVEEEEVEEEEEEGGGGGGGGGRRDHDDDSDSGSEDPNGVEVIMYPPPQREEMIAAVPKNRPAKKPSRMPKLWASTTGTEAGNMF
ncbi:MAG: hypothetical protein M1816_006090 [Peltula sp. TS41687]|nr:MAG: hypothetical protein M1816_006090 [Peltula sp. TS41687]